MQNAKTRKKEKFVIKAIITPLKTFKASGAPANHL